MLDISQQLALIKKNVVEIISEEELIEKLKENRPLIVKYGADPSRPDLHLGHTIPLYKLKTFQDLGHKVVFIIGDFTARIGDPSGVSSTRPQLSCEEVRENARTYAQQVFKILDRSKTELVYNSEWFEKMTFQDVLSLCSKYTVARMLERDDFARRYKEEKPIGIHEFLYPLMQGYDSVVIKADIEIGGTDQKFNLLVGRELQRDAGLKSQVIITLPILVGTDGKEKMSKSLNNYIGITDTSDDMFGKIMSISDETMKEYFRILTDIPLEEVEKMHPMDAKKMLAREIISLYHTKEDAELSQKKFESIFQKKELPQDMKEVLVEQDKIEISKLLTICGLSPSRAEAKRLIVQGAVEINGVKIINSQEEILIKDEIVIRVGKRRFAKVKKR